MYQFIDIANQNVQEMKQVRWSQDQKYQQITLGVVTRGGWSSSPSVSTSENSAPLVEPFSGPVSPLKSFQR